MSNDSHLHNNIVVDNVHGDIVLAPLERRIIDTASFQRLRKLKQLQFAHLVYPNATHTRFAHSLGVLKIMSRILARVNPPHDQAENLRLAALLHDIGHYPYSHLLEGVDKVVLTEDIISGKNRTLELDPKAAYPNHEVVGQEIVKHQADLLKILGSVSRAEEVGHLFSRSQVADQQLSKLIHSSLDMDRMDYLIRDSRAAGIPYGEIDINYLLNHVQQGEHGVIGISHKAVAAAEHFLLARTFVFRVICQHKTIYGLEECARQLLRRLKHRAAIGKEGYGIPAWRVDIENTARDPLLLATFTDGMLDLAFAEAASDSDAIIQRLAKAIASRRPPRLLFEHKTFAARDHDDSYGEMFVSKCQQHLPALAGKYGLPVEAFLVCELKPVGFENHGPRMTKKEAERVLKEGERTEMIQVFPSQDATEPVDIVDLKHSILHKIGDHVFRAYRLYVVHPEDDQDCLVKELREHVAKWLH